MKENKEKILKEINSYMVTAERINDELSLSQFYFEFLINITVFVKMRENIRGLIERKQREIFYPNPTNSNVLEDMNTIIKRYLRGDKEALKKSNYVILKKSGENDIFFDLVKNFVEKLNLEIFLEFENRYTLIYFFIEFENYLFKCFKYVLNRRPDIIEDSKVSLKDLNEAQGIVKNIIEDKVEEEALSKFDISLIIDKVIEKKIHNKFYKKYIDIFKYAYKVLGIQHSIEESDLKLLNFFKQIRNLYTHGDGTINQIFIKRIKNIIKDKNRYKKGEKFLLTDKLIKDLELIMKHILTKFDHSLITLFPELLYRSNKN